jgi:hypothetical protein
MRVNFYLCTHSDGVRDQFGFGLAGPAATATTGFEVTNCDLKAAYSAVVNCIMKSAGNHAELRYRL